MKFFKRHKTKNITVGIRECRTCDNNIRCEECAYPKENEMLKAEIEELKEDNFIKSQKRANIFEIVNAHEKGRAEAIKEVFQRLEKESEYFIGFGFGIGTPALARIKKEMVGEQE